MRTATAPVLLQSEADLASWLIAFCIAFAAILAFTDACAPKLTEPSFVTRQIDLSTCRRWSEQYRDAGPDAEMSAYDRCAEKVR